MYVHVVTYQTLKPVLVINTVTSVTIECVFIIFVSCLIQYCIQLLMHSSCQIYKASYWFCL